MKKSIRFTCLCMVFFCVRIGSFELFAQMGSWHTTSIIFGGHGMSFSAYDANHYYAACRYIDRNFIARTDDGGQNWKRVYVDSIVQYSDPNIPWKMPLDFGISYTSPSGLVLCSADSGRILRSTDFGETWVTHQFASDQPADVSFYNDQFGFMLIDTVPARLLRTTDGGVTWRDFPLTPYATNKSIALLTAIDSNSVFCLAVGYEHDSNAFLRTNDLGKTWSVNTHHPDIYNIVFTDSLHATCVYWATKDSTGSYLWDQIFTTDDGWATWHTALDTLDRNDPGGLFHVAFQDKMNGLAVGQLSTVYRTTDGGEHWVREHTDLGRASNNLVVAYPQGSDGVIMSSEAELLKFERGVGVPLLPQEQSGTLELSPNPVRAGGTFEIVLPSLNGTYHIQVSNVLGRTVREFDAVPHSPSIHLSASGLMRGQYFVHVTSGSRAWDGKLEVQ